MIVAAMVLASLFVPAGNSHRAACSEWQRLVDGVSPSERRTLQQGGAVFGERSFIVGDELISDCNARLEVGRYIYDAIRGRVSQKDRQIGNARSSEISAVLQHIWSASDRFNIMSDGSRNEIYTAILYLRRKDAHVLLGKILKADGISIDLSYVIIRSKFKEIGPDLLGFAISSQDANAKIYAYTTLAALHDPSGLRGLTQLMESDSLKNEQRHVVSQVLRKAKTRQITTEDLLDLEYEP